MSDLDDYLKKRQAAEELAIMAYDFVQMTMSLQEMLEHLRTDQSNTELLTRGVVDNWSGTLTNAISAIDGMMGISFNMHDKIEELGVKSENPGHLFNSGKGAYLVNSYGDGPRAIKMAFVPVDPLAVLDLIDQASLDEEEEKLVITAKFIFEEK